MAKKIIHIVSSPKQYGGGVYGKYISKMEGVKTYYLLQDGINSRIKKGIIYFFNLYKFSKKNSSDITIRNMDSCFFFNENQKNIVLVHHHDPVSKNKLVLWYQRFIYWNMLRKIEKIDTVVVGSIYWEKYFHSIGVENIRVIYNPFEVKKYRYKGNDAIVKFKKKYNLANKPIIYIGGLQKEKGADKSYNALKDLDTYLVSTGVASIQLENVIHLDLDFDEYITLLQSCSLAVLMSQFKEGWNRVAHEALLCRTPVIGTGYGGMGELLDETNQTICRDFSQLRDIVIQKLQEEKRVDDQAYAYVASFDIDRFDKAYDKILG